MRIVTSSICLLAAGMLATPALAATKASKKAAANSVEVQTQSGKTVSLRTMKMGGKTMILVPMDMGCALFHGMSKGC